GGGDSLRAGGSAASGRQPVAAQGRVVGRGPGGRTAEATPRASREASRRRPTSMRAEGEGPNGAALADRAVGTTAGLSGERARAVASDPEVRIAARLSGLPYPASPTAGAAHRAALAGGRPG